MSRITERIFFNDMIILSKALLDTLHIKNDLASLKGRGYWAANTQIKTDLKNIKSKGCIIAREGSVSNGKTKLVFDKINANLIFEDNMLKIVDTHTFINGNILKAEGQIDSDSFADLKIHSEKLPLPGLFLAFAPSDLKKSFILSSGNLSLDGRLQGELKKSLITASLTLKDFVMSDKNNSMIISNEKLIAGIVSDLITLDGNIVNKNFRLTLPPTGSVIKNPLLNVKLDESNINIKPFEILVNNASKINISGSVNSYASTPQIDLAAGGHLNAADLRKFAGREAEPFIDAQGNIPIKAKITGNDKKQSIIAQLKSDTQNYITPVHIQSMLNKQSILQAKIDYKGDRIHIRNTGLYTGISTFSDDLELNTLNAKEIFKVSGTIVKLNTPEPFINLIRISIPQEINAKLTAFKNSNLQANGKLVIFGKLSSPLMRGNFKVHGLRIPELFLTMDEADVNLSGKNIVLDVKRLLLNGSDINITARTDINPHPQFTISRLDVRSRLIDLDKLMKVPEALAGYTAPPLPSTNTQPADVPVIIRSGSINMRRIKTGEITATNTTGRISMRNNNFFLNNLRTTAFDGIIRGDITANIITMALQIRTRGTGLNVEKAVLALANMKDTISGDLTFRTDLTLSGTTLEEQMKSLKGTVTFAMTDGQLGPFGKLENMILAENIRESQFFQTALGGVINNLATVDTSHFSLMDGQIAFENGIAHINPITTIGNVMCLYIAGDFNLLENTTDMKVRAKLGSVIANMLGPIAQLNPINLVQATPGLNVVMAQAFSLFCEQLTPEESAAIPNYKT
ncbi:MAG: AsmA-like C-terminal region-containing protein [Candidatus Gastranaerophilaceae bacterium]